MHRAEPCRQLHTEFDPCLIAPWLRLQFAGVDQVELGPLRIEATIAAASIDADPQLARELADL